jgi:hypothetical protein
VSLLVLLQLSIPIPVINPTAEKLEIPIIVPKLVSVLGLAVGLPQSPWRQLGCIAHMHLSLSCSA